VMGRVREVNLRAVVVHLGRMGWFWKVI